MTVPRFVDTDVLLYSVSTDTGESAKRDRAREILRSRDLALSTQVLGEFYVQATRRSRLGALPHDAAVAMIRSLRRFAVEPRTVDVVEATLSTCERFAISYWDSTIIEAARAAGCTEVLSEDLSDGPDYGGVVVRNPFG